LKQPDGILQFYDSLDKQAVQGFFSRGLNYPVLVNNQKLIPFQITRAVTGNAVNIFKLVRQNGTEIDLIANVANIDPYPFDTFEQLIYIADTNLIETPPDGYYYLHIEDSVNTWYSDYFHLSSHPIGQLTFGPYTNSYSDSYQQEGISSSQDSGYFRMMFSNNKDLGDKVYQFGYYDSLILDSRFNPFHIWKGKKEEIILSESTGKEVINEITSYDEFEITFTVNRNIARVLSKLITLDSFSLVLQSGEEITADEFESDITNMDTDLYINVKITYRVNYGDQITNFVEA